MVRNSTTLVQMMLLAILAMPGCMLATPVGTLADDTVEDPAVNAYRPQFHFTYRKGWMSDVNGLLFHEGEYHLFSQHCPTTTSCDYPNTHWGHAVSPDLIHWQELLPALAPDELGPIFSGSAVVDYNNTSGFQSGREKPIVACYTAAGYILDDKRDGVICIAYSNDRGRTWTKYPGNPVLPAITHLNRDPKVFWHEPTRRWIMVITLSCGGWQDGDYRFALLSSSDLKQWREESRFDLPRGIDCPDLFELPVDGNQNNKRWVVQAGDGTYAVGDFDGKSFTREGPIRSPAVDWNENGANGYAAQTFNTMPGGDERRIQIAWLRTGVYPNMAFSQQATIPCELSLRSMSDGIHLCRVPVRELDALHQREWSWKAKPLPPSDSPLTDIVGELFDIRAEISPGTATTITFCIRGAEARYTPATGMLSCMDRTIHAGSTDGRLRLRLLVDRTTLEIFADDGMASLTFFLEPSNEKQPLRLSTSGGEATIDSLTAWTMKPRGAQ